MSGSKLGMIGYDEDSPLGRRKLLTFTFAALLQMFASVSGIE